MRPPTAEPGRRARLLAWAEPALMLLGRLRARLPQRFKRPGVLAVVLTGQGEVVLVRHRYVPGWHPPGGGRKRGESAEAAIRRELREEIGLTGLASLHPLPSAEAGLSLFLVRGARFRPRPSLEIAEVIRADPDRLPPGTSPRLRGLLARLPPPDATHCANSGSTESPERHNR